jgi:YD repeat-containing protein
MANDKLHTGDCDCDGATELARAFAQVHGLGELNRFEIHFHNRSGWIVRWFYDGVAQLQTMHMRIAAPMKLELRAPADRVMVLLELDEGGAMPFGAVRL